jgi:hypothetical protein
MGHDPAQPSGPMGSDHDSTEFTEQTMWRGVDFENGLWSGRDGCDSIGAISGTE